MALKKFSKERWNEYYAAQSPRPAARLLIQAVRLVRSSNLTALDLGCGTGNDALFLLNKGFKVHAFDAQKDAIKLLRRKVHTEQKKSLHTRVIRFEEITARDIPSLTVINANYSIFFCRQSSFARLWRNLNRKIERGGVFCGNFLGLRDSWANKRGLSSVSDKDLKQLFIDFDIKHISQREDDEPTLTGLAKHWHIYSVIARKK